MDGETIYDKDKETNYENKIPGTNIKVISTPGHALEHVSLLLDAKKGRVAVAADLFWWTDKEKQITNNQRILVNREDPFTSDRKALLKSRNKILEIADWIIPGHGKMFKSPDENRV